ncbi:MAG: hypothetical protein LBI17_01980 [Rickettsiales bacterium]|jgi:hypothetical protein|nr:hypothetical protein [Rickettsiales bacterium]
MGEAILNIFSFTGWQNLDILSAFVFNPGILVAILFITLISFTLVSESLRLADEFANSIGQGIGEDTVLKGIKQLTISTIKYIGGGVQRELKSHAGLRSYDRALRAAKGRLPAVDADGPPPVLPKNVEPADLDVPTLLYYYAVQEQVKAAGTYRTPNGAPPVVDRPHSIAPALVPEDAERDRKDWDEYTRSSKQGGIFVKAELMRADRRGYMNLGAVKMDKLDRIIRSEDPEKALKDAGDADISAFVEKLRHNPAFARNPKASPVVQIRIAMRGGEIADELSKVQSVPARDKAALSAAIVDGTTEELFKQRPDLKKIYDGVSSAVDAKPYKDKKKLANLEYRMNLRERYEDDPHRHEITPKDVMIGILSERIRGIQDEIANLGVFDGEFKRGGLNRQLGKYRKKLDAIKEQDNSDLADQVDSAVAKRRKRLRNKRIWRLMD